VAGKAAAGELFYRPFGLVSSLVTSRRIQVTSVLSAWGSRDCLRGR
jgi:hypothetical protein